MRRIFIEMIFLNSSQVLEMTKIVSQNRGNVSLPLEAADPGDNNSPAKKNKRRADKEKTVAMKKILDHSDYWEFEQEKAYIQT